MREQPFHRILRGIWVSNILIGLNGGLVSPQPVAAATLLDSADHTFIYPNLPDPVVWNVSTQGNVIQQPIDGAGLARCAGPSTPHHPQIGRTNNESSDEMDQHSNEPGPRQWYSAVPMHQDNLHPGDYACRGRVSVLHVQSGVPPRG